MSSKSVPWEDASGEEQSGLQLTGKDFNRKMLNSKRRLAFIVKPSLIYFADNCPQPQQKKISIFNTYDFNAQFMVRTGNGNELFSITPMSGEILMKQTVSITLSLKDNATIPVGVASILKIILSENGTYIASRSVTVNFSLPMDDFDSVSQVSLKAHSECSCRSRDQNSLYGNLLSRKNSHVSLDALNYESEKFLGNQSTTETTSEYYGSSTLSEPLQENMQGKTTQRSRQSSASSYCSKDSIATSVNRTVIIPEWEKNSPPTVRKSNCSTIIPESSCSQVERSHPEISIQSDKCCSSTEADPCSKPQIQAASPEASQPKSIFHVDSFPEWKSFSSPLQLLLATLLMALALYIAKESLNIPGIWPSLLGFELHLYHIFAAFIYTGFYFGFVVLPKMGPFVMKLHSP